MTTLGTMVDRIDDELDKGGTLTSQITKAIKSAISHYEKKRFWFNEARLTGLVLIDGQEFYTSADNSNIPNLLYIDTFKVARSATDKWPLDRMPFEEMDHISDNGTADEGQPTSYAYYAKQIRLYPIPDASYSAVVSGVYALADLSLTTDTNAWMTDGEALIRARAKWELYTHVIKDKESANDMAEAEAKALAAMIDANNARSSTGRILPTQF